MNHNRISFPTKIKIEFQINTLKPTNPNPSRAGELSHGLGPFRNSVLGELTREHEPHGGLDFPGSDRRFLVVPREPGQLLGELLEDVVDEAVHDSHGLAGDPDVRVDLLQHLEDVDLVGLHALLRSLLLLVSGGGSGLLRELLSGLGLFLGGGFLRHGRLLLLCWLLLGGLLLGFGRHCQSWVREKLGDLGIFRFGLKDSESWMFRDGLRDEENVFLYNGERLDSIG
ncbi:hypothetical protein DVH24_038705 [Malus domestica]|uniref:Uncharacterized protein n=1 Tax=Malus domestica TaxID=3750 RepID=A0A498KAF0_MALDO|nr:hypothetical protein DVH24_038705 [Malus domestica]